MSDVWLPSNFDRVLICQFVINLLCWIAVLKMFSISRELQLQTVGLTMMKWDRTYFDDHCQCTLMEAHTDTSEQCWDRKCGELLICWNSKKYFWSYDSRSAPLHDPKVQIEPQLLWYLIDCVFLFCHVTQPGKRFSGVQPQTPMCEVPLQICATFHLINLKAQNCCWS